MRQYGFWEPSGYCGGSRVHDPIGIRCALFGRMIMVPAATSHRSCMPLGEQGSPNLMMGHIAGNSSRTTGVFMFYLGRILQPLASLGSMNVTNASLRLS